MTSIDTERLLGQTAWLRALAMSLLGDEQLADDVVQDTWVAALARPPRDVCSDAGLRGWLARVARNAAHMRVRTDRRRLQRERSVARIEGVPGADAAFERLATQRVLFDAVLALELEDREVVVLRYFDGLPPRDIAKRLGTSSAAVRTRLSRALGRLRARLHRDFGGDASATSALSILVFGVPGRAVIAGITIMSGAMKWAAGAVVVALAGLWWWAATPGEVDRQDVANAAVPGMIEVAESAVEPGRLAPALEIVRQGVEDPPATASPAAAKKQRRLTALARCIDSAGVPIESATVIAVDIVGQPTAVTGADGRARLELDWPPQLTSGNSHWIEVVVTGPGRNRVRLQQSADNATTVQFGDVVLLPGGAVAGVVCGADGQPAPEVYVGIVQAVAPGDAAVEDRRRVTGHGFRPIDMSLWGRTDAAGAYRFDGVPVGNVAVVARPRSSYWVHTPPIAISAGGEARAPDLVTEPVRAEHTIRGRVFDHEGQPMVGAQIAVFPNHGARNIDAETRGIAAGEDAAFTVMVLSGQRYTLEVEEPGRTPRFVLLHDVEAGTSDVTIRFPPRRTFELEVTSARDAAIEELRVFCVAEDDLPFQPQWKPHGVGRLLIEAPAMPFSFDVHAAGHLTQRCGPFMPDAVPERVTVTLPVASAIRGRVLANGAPVAGARVHLHRVSSETALLLFAGDLQTRLDGERYGKATEATADGAFELFVQTSGRYVVHAEADGWAAAESVELPLEPGQSIDGVELTLAAPATLEGSVLVAAGVAVDGTLVAITRGDGHVQMQVVGADGAFRFTGLAAGGWQVRRCEPDDQQWLRQARTWPDYDSSDQHIVADVTLRSGQTTHYDLDLCAEVPAVLRGRLTLGAHAASSWRVTLSQGRQHSSGATDAVGRFELRARRPGTAWLSLSASVAAGQLSLQRTFALTVGENFWEHNVAVGAVEIAGLPPSAEPHPEAAVPGYALTWVSVDGAHWTLQFDPDASGGLIADDLPVGTVELRRRGAQEYTGIDRWLSLGSLVISAGGRVRFAYRPK